MTLSPAQRLAFTGWLRRYTRMLIEETENGNITVPAKKTAPVPSSSSPCSPAVESNITGDFEGWEGETVFKLDNGQIWEQAEYSYMYSYSYRPEVTIYETSSGCRMKVEDENETILVKRLK
ncbi:MAG: hypothetical protein ROO76_03390 [Terriglobia bacterium]|nr:hypothetical protein [Terriglobia bacterium]